MSILSFRYRIKDASRAKALTRHATGCNQVWNFCVATQRETQRRRAAGLSVRWLTAYDLMKLTSGCSGYFDVNAQTINEICKMFVHARDVNKKCPRFRSSFGPKRSLGWIPFTKRDVSVEDDTVRYRKKSFCFWLSRDLAGPIKTGAFVEDSRGRWYVTFQCAAPDDLLAGNGAIGIDLGLKTLATMSDGTSIPALRHYRKYEAALAIAQRAKNKPRVRAIHAKIANARAHHLHEQSTLIARKNSLIVVGNVNAAKLVKTKMAKSVLDAGWSSFRHMLRYKASRHGAVFIEANERWSSQVCSCCGTIPDSSPKGMGDLGMRRWDCSNCGASHDRDVNAAKNILRVGLECQPPAGGISASLSAVRH